MTPSDSGQHFATRARAEKKSPAFFSEAGRGKAVLEISNLAKFNPGLILLMGDAGSGKSRVLKQLEDSLKGKTSKICVINRAVKNERQLYSALSDGFRMDIIPEENLKSIQRQIHAYIEKAVVHYKPVIIALDDVQHCTPAMLEILVQLQAKFSQMSLLLIGDTGLHKKLQRSLVGDITMHPITLNALDVRDIRQYLSWRLSYALIEPEVVRIATACKGNLRLLEQEALKKELASNQNANSRQGSVSPKTKTRFAVSMLLLLVLAGGMGASWFFYREQLSEIIFGAQQKPVEQTSVKPPTPIEPPVRNNEAWVDRQIFLLTEN